MLEKLRQIENRYSELESKLADPAYYSDPAVFTKLCREQRELQPVVETYRAYTACQAQIAQAEALLDDPERRAAMGERGYGALQTRFNWQTEEKKLLALYEELLSLKGE